MDSGGLKEACIRWVAYWRHLVNMIGLCVAVMQPFVKLCWPFVYIACPKYINFLALTVANQTLAFSVPTYLFCCLSTWLSLFHVVLSFQLCQFMKATVFIWQTWVRVFSVSHLWVSFGGSSCQICSRDSEISCTSVKHSPAWHSWCLLLNGAENVISLCYVLIICLWLTMMQQTYIVSILSSWNPVFD